MKKLLLAGTAIAGFAMLATPAIADGLELELGGFYRGYGVYTDNDEPAADSRRTFDLRDDVEIHFSGETTLDNGLTVGAHAEMKIAENATSNTADEIYAYFSGSWGRVNFGHEDGAQYLLQVAAPSADSNVDGLRTYIQGYDLDLANTIQNAVGVGATGQVGSPALVAGQVGINNFNGLMDYDMAMGKDAMKLTYLTPKYSGFQAGVTFAPEVTDGTASVNNGTAPVANDNNAGQFEDLWELAARWDGEYEGVGITVGAGYGNASTEVDLLSTTGVGPVVIAPQFIGSDDRTQWNVASTVSMAGFSLGGSYSEDDYGMDGQGAGDGLTTWVAGTAWDNGPYHVGVSYLNSEFEYGSAANESVEFDRITVGGTYTYGPGMTFRGAVAFGSVDDNATPANDRDFSQVTIGTEVSF